MKIKQTRQVRLDELLQLVWSNKFDYFIFKSDNNGCISFDTKGIISHAYDIKPDDLFTITEEVEITEETKFNHLIGQITEDSYESILNVSDIDNEHILNLIDVYKNVSINDLLTNIGRGVLEFKFIYLQNEDGSIGDLIWKDGKFIE